MKINLLLLIFFFSAMLSRGQWSYTDLTEAKHRMGVITLGTKAYFAGGESDEGQVSAIEIYDVETGDWDPVINLLMPRSHIACTASGTKVFFAGGIDFGAFIFYDIVEIWDSETGEWSYTQLSAPRFSISAVSYENKVLFAGGANMITGLTYDLVDIYNTETGEWSTATLSLPRSAMGAAIAGDCAFFGGGIDGTNVTDRVDIYNFTTDSWSTTSLSQARAFLTAVTVGTKVLFAGGTTADNEPSDRVDIFDTETQSWSTAILSQPRAFWDGNSGSTCDGKAYFVGGGIMNLNPPIYDYRSNVIDIYSIVDDTWTTDTTITPVFSHSVVGVEEHLLIAGGSTNSGNTSLVQIFTGDTCIWPGVDSKPEVRSSQLAVSCYPNPTAGNSQFTVHSSQEGYVTLKVYDIQGREIAVLVDEYLPAGEHIVSFDASGLPAGIYLYRLTVGGQRSTVSGKIVKY